MLKKVKLRIEDFIEITFECENYKLGTFREETYVIADNKAMKYTSDDEIEIFWRLKDFFNEETEESILRAIASVGFENFKTLLLNDEFSAMLSDSRQGVHFLEGLGLKVGEENNEKTVRIRSDEGYSSRFA